MSIIHARFNNSLKSLWLLSRVVESGPCFGQQEQLDLKPQFPEIHEYTRSDVPSRYKKPGLVAHHSIAAIFISTHIHIYNILLTSRESAMARLWNPFCLQFIYPTYYKVCRYANSCFSPVCVAYCAIHYIPIFTYFPSEERKTSIILLPFLFYGRFWKPKYIQVWHWNQFCYRYKQFQLQRVLSLKVKDSPYLMWISRDLRDTFPT